MITDVTATTITCTGCAADAAASGRTITAGIPFKRAFDNVLFEPIPGFPYIEEDFIPATTSVRTLPVAVGYTEDTGLYVVKVFGIAGTGLSVRRYADEILARFTPGTTFTLSDGTTLRIPAENGPYAGQVTPVEGGWAYVAITVPYLGESINAVAA